MTTIFSILALLAQWFGFAFSREIFVNSCEPSEINYNSFDPYCLKVIKLNLALNSRWIITISKAADPDYGFILNYPSPDIIGNEEIEGLKVFWKPEGIELETMWNVRLFIPKQRFVGGR